MPASKPNVLFVTLDSACPHWLSCYGCPDPTSPQIDAIASQSMVFQTAISPSSWTFPVMASVFTGMLPTKHGGHDQHQSLDSAYPTMAEILRSGGYATAAFADVPFVGPMTRLDRGFETMSNLRGHEVSLKSKVLKGLRRIHQTFGGGYRKTFETPVLIGEALHWLRRGWDRQKPFFLYLHSDETHAPFLPPGHCRRKFAGISARKMYGINQDKELYIGGVTRMTEEDFEHLKGLAKAEVAHFDRWLGRLLDWLHRERMFEDTVVVIAADHGDNVGEHGLLRHAMCLYDTLLHVPLIIKTAGQSKPIHIAPMIRLIDLLPTVMRLTGVKDVAAERELQGSDLIEAVRRNEYPEWVISELYPPASMHVERWAKKAPGFVDNFRDKYDRKFRSVRSNTHKYIWASRGKCELYDLRSDPGEEHNLIDAQPEVARKMQQTLDNWLASFQAADQQDVVTTDQTEDESVLARLRDLGYIE